MYFLKTSNFHKRKLKTNKHNTKKKIQWTREKQLFRPMTVYRDSKGALCFEYNNAQLSLKFYNVKIGKRFSPMFEDDRDYWCSTNVTQPATQWDEMSSSATKEELSDASVGRCCGSWLAVSVICEWMMLRRASECSTTTELKIDRATKKRTTIGVQCATIQPGSFVNIEFDGAFVDNLYIPEWKRLVAKIKT